MAFLAYIDPGSGSMLLQVLLAGALSAPFLFRRAIGNALRRLRRRPAESTVRSEPEERR
jgi:hypothetical protein